MDNQRHVYAPFPTSEVGSLQAPVDDRDNIEENELASEQPWQAMFEIQNRNMMELIKTLQTQKSSVPPKVELPEFNPDIEEANARAWCGTADLCMQDQPLQGSALVIAMSRAFKGSAAAWFSQISYAGMNWAQLREIFLARYDTVETPAATLIHINNSRPKEGECLAAYAGRLMTSLMSRWQDMSVEQIAVSTVLAHCVRIEPNLQRLALTSDPATRHKMQQELMGFAYRKRNVTDTPYKGHKDGPTYTYVEYSQSGLPPSYEEYLCHKYAMIPRSHTPPPPWSDSMTTDTTTGTSVTTATTTTPNARTRREMLASQPEIREYLAQLTLAQNNERAAHYQHHQGAVLREQQVRGQQRARAMPPRSQSESRAQQQRIATMYDDAGFCMEPTVLQSALEHGIALCSLM